MWRVSRTKCGEPGRFRSRSRVAHVMQMLLTAWTVSKQEGRLGVRLPDDPQEAGRGLTAPQGKEWTPTKRRPRKERVWIIGTRSRPKQKDSRRRRTRASSAFTTAIASTRASTLCA